MHNVGLPWIVWAIYKKQYKKGLTLFSCADRKAQMRRVANEYERILTDIPSFGKNDVLLINLLSAAALAAVYRTLPEKPSVARMREYYKQVMDTPITRAFLKGQNQFSAGYQRRLCKQGELSQQATNPYTWRFAYHAGETLDSFDAIFDKCGICELYRHLGIPELTPALCTYDYDMANVTGAEFMREYTLASGGPVCDCHYKKVNA